MNQQPLRSPGEKTFLLGVGAQKAGTTWLHRYITQDRAVAIGAMKEFHVWSDLQSAPRDRIQEVEGDHTGEKERLRRRMLQAPDFYFDYFADLLSAPGKTLSADITPAYAALPAEAYRVIRTGFEKRGIAVRAIFLMRDPVERCWSAVRMYRRKKLGIPGLDISGDLERSLVDYCRTPHAQGRGRYDKTIEALESAFDGKDIHYGLYETLFEPESLARLSAFLDIPPSTGFAHTRYNESPKEASISSEARSVVAGAFREALQYCGQRFPESRSLWPSYSLAGVSGE